MSVNSNNCDLVLEQLEAYNDGELALSDRQLVESHIDDCEHCRASHQRLQLLKQTLQINLSEKSPLGLKRKIRQDLRQITQDDNREHYSRIMNWLGIAGGMISVMTLVVWMFVLVPTQQPNPSVSSQIVAAHIRSLQVDHLSDVNSSDQHTVKPWFSGKLGFSPIVHDYSTHGFPLSGGRLGYVDGKNVAAVVYKRRKHVINLFMWPVGQTGLTSKVLFPQSVQHIKGYNLLHWKTASMNYWLISDLNAKELNLFSAMLKLKL